ncbi:MAG TPA: hypothetical protein VGM91_11495 [Conexibacter sp.]
MSDARMSSSAQLGFAALIAGLIALVLSQRRELQRYIEMRSM